MKRILATVLAALLILGVFATGASAATLWDIPAKSSLISLPSAEGRDIAQTLTVDDYNAIYRLLDAAELQASMLMAAEPAYAACYLLGGNPLALNAGKTISSLSYDFNNSIATALATNADIIAIQDELYQLLYDDAALEALYRGGTLQAAFEDMFLRMEMLCLPIYQRIATEYFKPQALEATNALSQVYRLAADVYRSNLSAAKKNELITAIFNIETTAFGYLDIGYWSLAKSAADSAYKNAQNILIKAGFLPVPPKGIFGTNPKYNQWWHYILFFLCFGFIWMWF